MTCRGGQATGLHCRRRHRPGRDPCQLPHPGPGPSPAASVSAAVAVSCPFLPVFPFLCFPDCAQNPDETTGWPAARRHLLAALVEHAPIDGLLGFSQGATVAAVLAAATADPHPAPSPPPPEQPAAPLAAAPAAPAGTAAAAAETAALARLRFVILVSGFPPRHHLAGVLSPARPLRLPSLHVMGEADAQVPVAACRALAECFSPAEREVYVHGGGHLVPSSAGARARVVSFVARFAAGGGVTGRNAHL